MAPTPESSTGQSAPTKADRKSFQRRITTSGNLLPIRVANPSHGKLHIWSFKTLNKITDTMDGRPLDLTEAQKATKAKYPPINKKYECKSEVIVIVANLA